MAYMMMSSGLLHVAYCDLRGCLESNYYMTRKLSLDQDAFIGSFIEIR
jgi:hypothetical protein